MDNVESICEQYYKILDSLDIIEHEIAKSDYTTDSDIKPAKHNFYTNFAITVPNILGELARVESDVIEAEHTPGPQRINPHVAKPLFSYVENYTAAVTLHTKEDKRPRF